MTPDFVSASDFLVDLYPLPRVMNFIELHVYLSFLSS